MAEVSLAKLLSDGCHWTLLVISQHWFSCHQATSNYLSQCWRSSLSPYGINVLTHWTLVDVALNLKVLILNTYPSVDRIVLPLHLPQYQPDPFHINTSLSTNFRRCVGCWLSQNLNFCWFFFNISWLDPLYDLGLWPHPELDLGFSRSNFKYM